jgi:hypothetical protein
MGKGEGEHRPGLVDRHDTCCVETRTVGYTSPRSARTLVFMALLRSLDRKECHEGADQGVLTEGRQRLAVLDTSYATCP